MCAGGRQQRLADAKLVFEQGMAFLGKLTIARQLPIDDRLLHKLKFFSRKGWAIKAKVHG
jgi:hypothetical protein